MATLFINTVISCFAVTCIWFVMLPGEIFGWLGSALGRVLPEKLHDPFFSCPICMFPWYGIPFYIFIINHGRKWQTRELIFELLIVLFLGIGLQVLFTSFISYLRDK